MKRHPLVTLAAGVAVAFLVLPIVGLVAQAPWSRWLDVLATDQVRQALVLSLVCATVAAAIALVLALPLAWVLADPTTPGRSVLRGLCVLGLVLPPVVSGIALLAALGPQGIVGRPLYD